MEVVLDIDNLNNQNEQLDTLTLTYCYIGSFFHVLPTLMEENLQKKKNLKKKIILVCKGQLSKKIHITFTSLVIC